MTDLKIHYSESDTKGHYAAEMSGVSEEAELTISKVSSSLFIVDHTYVPDALRGQGIAKVLANRVITDARTDGQRIVPLCPFFRAFAERNREDLTDVIQW